jgi:hypothetical protein
MSHQADEQVRLVAARALDARPLADWGCERSMLAGLGLRRDQRDDE